MLLLLLGACATLPFGTWMFQRVVTQATGDECATTLSHNYTGAYEPLDPADDPSWSAETTATVSNEVFYGRIEGTEDGSAVMIFNSETLIGTRGNGDLWTFAWENTEAGEVIDTHSSGYQFDWLFDDTATTRVSGTFADNKFTGSWAEESESTDKYTESDTWSDEAAAYVGTTGLTPAGTYLLVMDAYGTETAASNTYTTYDCDAAGCALTVQAVCGYQYDLTGVLTDFVPDDNRWVEGAGQPAGLP